VYEFDDYFDVILLDAPCSSEWRINLNIEKIWNNWTMWNITRNYKVQKEILKNNISLLKSGWELIYSTCTLAPEENEAVVHFLLCNYKDLEIVDITSRFGDDFRFKNWIKSFWEVVFKRDVEKSIRALPSEITEGFFVAKFRKK
jgi:16S rRNA C967 or C1407 C5-methylase (RsmB/RsmF family)